jgi:uncharacterized membrane protein
MKILRWLLFLPLGFIASVLLGYLATTITDFIGGASWYVWLISGAVSGGAFIIVSLKVAPEENSTSKWLTFVTVTTLGLLSALGPILAGGELASSFAGVAMIGMAIYVIRPFNKKNETNT